MKKYILKGHEAVREDDIKKWTAWYEKADRRVIHTEITRPPDSISRISTIFLGIDRSRENSKTPLLFETRVFGGPYNGQITRCSTWEQAEKMHNDICEKNTKHGKGKDYG